MFPSMDAFGGWGGLMGHRAREVPKAKKLSELNRGCQRFPDTFTSDYAGFLRNPDTGADLGPLGTVPDKRVVLTVGLVGAGIANLVAAYELARCGIVPVIFEASGRVGGRLHTHDLGGVSGVSGELGAMRVPDGSKLFWHYFDKYWTAVGGKDVTIKPFPNPGVVPTHLNWQNDVWQFWNEKPHDTWQNLPEIFNRTQDEFSKRVEQYKAAGPGGPISFKRVHDALRQKTLSAADESDVKLYWNSCIADFEKRSLGSVIADMWYPDTGGNVQWGPNEISAFAALGLGTGGFGPLFPVSYLEILRLMLWDYSGEYPVPAPSSMSAFAQWFPDKIFAEVEAHHPGHYQKTDLLKLDTEVLGISVQESIEKSHVVIQAGQQSHGFDYCIVGMTQRAMQKLGLDGNARGPAQKGWQPFSLGQRMSSGQRAIIESVQSGIRWTNVMSASKTFARIANQSFSVWPKYHDPDDPVHFIKVTLTDKYPKASYWLEGPSDAAYSSVLTSYTWGNDSVKLEAVNSFFGERLPLFASTFALMSSEPAPCEAYSQIEEVLDQTVVSRQEVTIDWQSQRHYYGGFKLDLPGDYYYTSSLAFQYLIGRNLQSDPIPAQHVYLTGDSVSFLGGWIEGAMMSAVNAVTVILHRYFLAPRSSALLMNEAMPFHKYQHIGGGVLQQQHDAEAALAQ